VGGVRHPQHTQTIFGCWPLHLAGTHGVLPSKIFFVMWTFVRQKLSCVHKFSVFVILLLFFYLGRKESKG
jgi:hypothetical protein